MAGELGELFSSRKPAAVTKSDTVNFPGGVARALYVGGAGTVALVRTDGVVCNFVCPAGARIDAYCIRVNATNTDATNIVAYH